MRLHIEAVVSNPLPFQSMVIQLVLASVNKTHTPYTYSASRTQSHF